MCCCYEFEILREYNVDLSALKHILNEGGTGREIVNNFESIMLGCQWKNCGYLLKTQRLLRIPFLIT
jgi:hypothetical protein